MEHYTEVLQNYNLALDLDSNNPEHLNAQRLTYQAPILYEKSNRGFLQRNSSEFGILIRN